MLQPQYGTTEFVDRNMTMRYPFVDTAGAVSSADPAVRIPDSFLVDATVVLRRSERPSQPFRESLHVSSLIVLQDYAYVTIADRELGDIAISGAIPMSLDTGSSLEDRTISLYAKSDISVSGSIVIGTCVHLKDIVGTHTFSYTQTLFFPTCVVVTPDSSLGGIWLDDNYITGDIYLQAGDGVSITYDDTTNTISFSAVGGDTDVTIQTDDDLLTYITNKYGPPITAVNGISTESVVSEENTAETQAERPNRASIYLSPQDCITITDDPDNNRIMLSNPCGNTCASDEFMEDTYQRIADLNTNYDTISSTMRSISSSLTQMAARLTHIFATRK